MLVVDDDEDTRDLVAAMVRSRGMSVVTAPDGPSGVEAAMSGPFDVIIVDVVMPGVDGIEVLHEIHAHVDSTVPVVTMTAQPRRAPKSTSLGQGAVAHLRKPLQRSVLIDVIDKLL
ncbi:response regulator [Kineosporia sp. R_H_3]|uniref:response regulator n=1 Tax=Kineosporia sp. R_H_3 TaxID=1961848 RepID=UPI00130460FB|nr:response regulator [Kineosporia sp. R_H_3]